MASEGFVTYREMTEYQDSVKKDLIDRIDKGDKNREKLEDKVEIMDEKLDNLNKVVLPLTLAMEQTAENTKEISQSLKEFTKQQSKTNTLFHDKINDQAMTIKDIKNVTDGFTDKKKYNATVIVALIGLVGVFITGLFQLAPLIFTQ